MDAKNSRFWWSNSGKDLVKQFVVVVYSQKRLVSIDYIYPYQLITIMDRETCNKGAVSNMYLIKIY